jgi:hypothetical protein
MASSNYCMLYETKGVGRQLTDPENMVGEVAEISSSAKDWLVDLILITNSRSMSSLKLTRNNSLCFSQDRIRRSQDNLYIADRGKHRYLGENGSEHYMYK